MDKAQQAKMIKDLNDLFLSLGSKQETMQNLFSYMLSLETRIVSLETSAALQNISVSPTLHVSHKGNLKGI
jgi:uncharacterized coiled-coil protein SlyX